MDAKRKAKVLERFVVEERLHRIDQVLDARTSSLTLVLEGFKKPHNVSAVLRSADAFGLRTVHLVGESFEYNRTISLGTERWMDLVPHASPESACEALHTAGYSLVVLQPEGDSRVSAIPSLPITALPFERPLALVFGSEQEGVSQCFVEHAAFHAFVPMYGFVESLNVSVACALCLFCSTIAETRTERRTSPLSAEERDELRAEWLEKSVRAADHILKEAASREEEET